MRRLLHAFFALTVFSTASSGLCSLPPDFTRPCVTGCAEQSDQRGSDHSTMPSCCCAVAEAPAQPAGSCSSQSQKCGTLPTVSLQLGLTQGEKSQAAEASEGTRPSEPKPWPLSWSSAWSANVLADSADALLSTCPARRSRSLAEAWLQGQCTIERLSRLSAFRI